MTHISTAQLAQLAQIEKRQIQRILDKGTPDLGATRTPGGHWLIPDTPAVRRWAKNRQRWNGDRSKNVPQPVIDPAIFQPGKLTIDPDTAKKGWRDIHRTVIQLRLSRKGRKQSRGWIKQSRNFAGAKWGVDYVASAEIQIEDALGISQPVERPRLNADDKGTGILTIEGLSLGFSMWHRKMVGELPRWDGNRLDRAIELLDHPARVHAELVELRASLKSRK